MQLNPFFIEKMMLWNFLIPTICHYTLFICHHAAYLLLLTEPTVHGDHETHKGYHNKGFVIVESQ